MALVGGGGAGNTAGSNPSGTGSTINYVGEFAYLHSGSVSVNNTDTTLGKFATQAEIIDSKIQFHYTEDASDDMIYTVKILLQAKAFLQSLDVNYVPKHSEQLIYYRNLALFKQSRIQKR